MDKFGIFNILSSLINQNTSSAPTSSSQKVENKDALSSLISSLLKNNSSPNANQNPTQNLPKSHAPLNKSMLSTMSNHDQFIKRVKERSNTNKI